MESTTYLLRDAKNKDIAIIYGDTLFNSEMILQGNPQLKAENPLYSNIEIKNKEDLIIWGVCIHSIIN